MPRTEARVMLTPNGIGSEKKNARPSIPLSGELHSNHVKRMIKYELPRSRLLNGTCFIDPILVDFAIFEI
jgi:hypothetical protein